MRADRLRKRLSVMPGQTALLEFPRRRCRGSGVVVRDFGEQTDEGSRVGLLPMLESSWSENPMRLWRPRQSLQLCIVFSAR